MNNNPLQMVAQLLQRGISPDQLIQMLGQKNPQLMNQVQQIKQQYPNKSYEDLTKTTIFTDTINTPQMKKYLQVFVTFLIILL
jgi:hypothetical protein